MRMQVALCAVTLSQIVVQTVFAEVMVVIPKDPEPAIRIAADEFAKYHELSTGIRPPVGCRATGDGPFVRIGIPEPGMSFDKVTDSYYIRSKDRDLVLVGGNGRSTLYAVYDFFRIRTGAAYFWDGDVIAKRSRLDFTGLDVFERSRFEYRACQYFAHRGLTRFNAEHWGFEDWKREVDWAVKNRLNVIRLCLGIEDLFQRAFPDIVPYPDSGVTMPTDGGEGYDRRSPFWSLQFRSLLRKAVVAYARDRGLSLPVEFGPQTHWYARTPREFLDARHPAFMPQVSEDYSQPSGRMWDCREKEWFDSYFAISEAAIGAYGYSGLLFNPGFDERMVYPDREDNVRLKIDMLCKFNDEAARRHPDARLLMEGWDFYLTWKPNEMQRLIARLNPTNTILWDFTGDDPNHNFIEWGVTNRFPYVFGFTLAHGKGTDIRTNYSVIRQNEQAMKNDSMCKGYCLWPEDSHSDIFGWRYFTDNCWTLSDRSVVELLERFCNDRYGAQGKSLLRTWKLVVPNSVTDSWSRNFLVPFQSAYESLRNDEGRWKGADPLMRGFPVIDVIDSLLGVEWTGEFVRRDTIDLLRTALDRRLTAAFEDLMSAYCRCRCGAAAAEDVRHRADFFVALVERMSELLQLHTDYSLAESLDRLNAVENIRNPEFEKILFDNASCDYCMSHHAELARGWYVPRAREIAGLLARRVESGDFSPLPRPTDYRAEMRSMDHPIRSFAPDATCRTEAGFRRVLRRIQDVFKGK